MKIPMYQVDAFTKEPFRGNPAAVCVLETWPDDAVLQNIAAENNLAETAFIVKADPGYDLRWFTPEVEMDLCGHATLASAWVVFNFLQPELDSVSFRTMSGMLGVTRDDRQLLSMNFPSRPPEKTDFQDVDMRLKRSCVFKCVMSFRAQREIFFKIHHVRSEWQMVFFFCTRLHGAPGNRNEGTRWATLPLCPPCPAADTIGMIYGYNKYIER